MPVIRQKIITREDLWSNPEVVYVFGDNEARVGQGGQAKAMRGEPNAHGIRTKKAPGYEDSAYWYDKDFENFLNNCRMVDEDFGVIKELLFQKPNAVVVFPKDGFGTGLAELNIRAIATLHYIEAWYSAFTQIAEVKPLMEMPGDDAFRLSIWNLYH